MLQKSHQLDDAVLAGAARARARVLALVHGALRASGCDQVTLASRLGIRKAAVNALLHGNGNVRINSLAEYLGVLGFEVDLVAVPLGEIEAAREERRSPRHVVLTTADDDRKPDADAVTIHQSGSHRAWATYHRIVVGQGTANLHGDLDPMRVSNLKDGYARRLEASRS